MISRHFWRLRAFLRRIWVRVTLFAVLAVASVALARVLSPLLPDWVADQVGTRAVDGILQLLATSMLAVTTFSLSIAVSAFAAAAQFATPRATALLQQDPTTQNVLATFLGAFLFSLLGLIALDADLYDPSGRVVLFFATLAVTGLVIIALIRWIEHLMSFGRMGNTLDRVEAATRDALAHWRKEPHLGGHPFKGPVPAGGMRIDAPRSGYVQHIDMALLDSQAERCGVEVVVGARPGGFIAKGARLATVRGDVGDTAPLLGMANAFAIGQERDFEGDPRFGLIVLSEIASRALSPAVNDPGTAISVLGRMVRLLTDWPDHNASAIFFRHVHVPEISAHDLLVDAFRPIARDGAGIVEVQIRLQKALLALHNADPETFSAAAAPVAHAALHRAEHAGLLEDEVAALRGIAQWSGAG